MFLLLALAEKAISETVKSEPAVITQDAFPEPNLRQFPGDAKVLTENIFSSILQADLEICKPNYLSVTSPVMSFFTS